MAPSSISKEWNNIEFVKWEWCGMLAVLQQLSLSLRKRSEVLGLAESFWVSLETGQRKQEVTLQPVRCDGGWMPSFLDFPPAQMWHVPRESPRVSRGLTSSSHGSVSSCFYSFLTSVPSTWPLPPLVSPSPKWHPNLFRVYSFEDPRLRQWEFCNNNLFSLSGVWL